jgi:hypothetical protein
MVSGKAAAAAPDMVPAASTVASATVVTTCRVLIAPRYGGTGPRVYVSSRATDVQQHSRIGRSNESAGISPELLILLGTLAFLALLLVGLLLLLLGLLLVFLGFASLIVDDFLVVGIVVLGGGR